MPQEKESIKKNILSISQSSIIALYAILNVNIVLHNVPVNIKESKLSLTDVKKLASQAHSLGCWQWNLQGGEPLLWTNLEEIIQTINPSRFYFFITTNGWFMTEQRAKQLAQMGVDKICISLDSFNSEEHDTHRGMPGAFDKALAALEYVKKENMVANINFTVTHANIKSPLLKEVISFAQEKGYLITFMIAIPAGKWAKPQGFTINV